MKNEVDNEHISIPSIEINNQIEYMKYCHNKIDEIKSSTYQRASILVLVIGFILPSWASTIRGIIDNIPKEIIVLKIILLILCALFLLTFLMTTVYAFKSVNPFKNKSFLLKILNANKKDFIELSELAKFNLNTEMGKNRVFTTFEYIYDLKKYEFEKMAKELSLEKTLEQLINSIYNLSCITKRRYKDLNAAYRWLFVNIITFILLIMLGIIANVIWGKIQ